MKCFPIDFKLYIRYLYLYILMIYINININIIMIYDISHLNYQFLP